jgi:hypothetical protein
MNSQTGGILKFVKRPGLITSGQNESLTMLWFFLPLLIVFIIAGVVFGAPGRYERRSVRKVKKTRRAIPLDFSLKGR